MNRFAFLEWTVSHDSSSSSCNLHRAAAAPAACRRFLPARKNVVVIAVVVLTCCCIAAVLQFNQNRLHNTVAAFTSEGPLNPDTVWEQREVIKASMPRTTYFDGWTVDTLQRALPIWVISLARAKERREAMIKGLKAAGVKNYEIIDAVDYRHNTTAEVHTLLKKYANTWKRHLWYRQQKHVSSKIAIDMSHYRLLERVAASNRSALILEDDAQLTGEQWLPDLLTALQELPQDWDILYLNAVYTTRGRAISPHLVVVRRTPGTIGYVVTPGFAHQALEAAKDPNYQHWVDILFEWMTAAHNAQAYIAEPPLVHYMAVPSTIDSGDEDMASWERKWAKNLNG